MKKYFILLSFFAGISLSAQMAVSVVTDSPATIAFLEQESLENMTVLANIGTFFTNVTEQLNTAMETLSLVSGTYDTIMSQVEAIELMTSGDYVSFIQGIEAQGEALSSFSGVMSGLNSDTYSALRSPEFTASITNLSEGSSLLSNSVYKTSDMLWATNDLAENTANRIKTLGYLADSTEGGSLLGQLQLQNTAVQMMMGELADLKTVTIAGNNATLAQQDYEKFIAQAENKLNEDMRKDSTGVMNPKVTAVDYKSAVFGDYK